MRQRVPQQRCDCEFSPWKSCVLAESAALPRATPRVPWVQWAAAMPSFEIIAARCLGIKSRVHRCMPREHAIAPGSLCEAMGHCREARRGCCEAVARQQQLVIRTAAEAAAQTCNRETVAALGECPGVGGRLPGVLVSKRLRQVSLPCRWGPKGGFASKLAVKAPCRKRTTPRVASPGQRAAAVVSAPSKGH